MSARGWRSAAGLSLLVLLGGLALWVWSGWADPQEPFLLGGIQVNEPDHGVWAQGLLDAGFNTVSVTVYAHQGNWDSDHLWYDTDNPAVLSEIRAAKAAGLRVVLILRLALDHAFEANRFLWHGQVMPKSDQAVRSWFLQYGNFVEAWARHAEAEGVNVLGIGSELNSMTSTRPVTEIPALQEYYLNPLKQEEYKTSVLSHRQGMEQHHLWSPGTDGFATLDEYLDAEIGARVAWARGMVESPAPPAEGEEPWEVMNRRRRQLEEHWLELIAKVRKIYGGRLTYAANFDQYQEVGFWDHLDLMGINGYFQLRTPPDPQDPASGNLGQQLEQGWTAVLEEIVAFRLRQELGEMPVIFTELGYTSRRGSTVEPWASQGFSLIHLPAPPEAESPAAAPGEAAEAPGSAEATEPTLPSTRLMVWTDEPLAPEERAQALAALRRAAETVDPDLVQGLLYWKLSTLPGHREIEPFVLILGDQPEDPLEAELRRFRSL